MYKSRFRYFEYVETGDVNLAEFQELNLGARGNWGPSQARNEAGRTDETGMTYIGESKDQISEMSIISRWKEEKEYGS